LFGQLSPFQERLQGFGIKPDAAFQSDVVQTFGLVITPERVRVNLEQLADVSRRQKSADLIFWSVNH
jgi:hypothetical protein